MLSILLISFAAVCNAVMDVCQFHYDRSIFTFYDHKFWNAEISWKNKYVDWDNGDRRRKKWFWKINYPVQFTDAWHLFKSLMIIFFALAIILYRPVVNELIDFGIFGIVWNATFNVYYNTVFMLKKK